MEQNLKWILVLAITKLLFYRYDGVWGKQKSESV